MASARNEIDRRNGWFLDNLDNIAGNTFKMIMDLREKDYRTIFQALSSLMVVRDMTIEGLENAPIPVEKDTAEQAAEECLAEAAEWAAQNAAENRSENDDTNETKRRLNLLALAAPLANLNQELARLG